MVISEPLRQMHRPERNKAFGGAAGSVANDAQDEEDEKPRTLFVGNVPREVHKREIEEVFGDIGPLKRCYIQYPRDGNGELVGKKSSEINATCFYWFGVEYRSLQLNYGYFDLLEKKKQREDTTVAYVTFALSQDATKALETLQNTKIGNNRVNIKFAKARSEQVRPTFGGEGRGRFHSNANFEPIAGAIQKPKEPRPKPIKKKSRLIIRNLSFKVGIPFIVTNVISNYTTVHVTLTYFTLIFASMLLQVTEEKLREHFKQFGDLKDINILKKPNGKLVGCAFVQYQNIYQAANAIKELNLKPFLGKLKL